MMKRVIAIFITLIALQLSAQEDVNKENSALEAGANMNNKNTKEVLKFLFDSSTTKIYYIASDSSAEVDFEKIIYNCGECDKGNSVGWLIFEFRANVKNDFDPEAFKATLVRYMVESAGLTLEGVSIESDMDEGHLNKIDRAFEFASFTEKLHYNLDKNGNHQIIARAKLSVGTHEHFIESVADLLEKSSDIKMGTLENEEMTAFPIKTELTMGLRLFKYILAYAYINKRYYKGDFRGNDNQTIVEYYAESTSKGIDVKMDIGKKIFTEKDQTGLRFNVGVEQQKESFYGTKRAIHKDDTKVKIGFEIDFGRVFWND